MVLKLVHSWQVAGAGRSASGDQDAVAQALLELDNESDEQTLDYDDPLAISARERKAEKQKVQDREAALERRQEQRHFAEQTEQDDEERRLHEWLASAQYRRAVTALSDDITDARRSISWARDRAAAEQMQAREALEKAQRNALVAEGGHRVYLTRDGSRLYGEDDRQITDQAVLAGAQAQQRAKPISMTYEDYVEKKNADRVAAEKVEQLRQSAAKLDELDRRIKKGNLSPEDLAAARQEQQDVVGALPTEAREEYERLRAVRAGEQKLAYRAADPAFTSAPDLNADFRQAGMAAAPNPKQDSQTPAAGRAPIYKSAPDY